MLNVISSSFSTAQNAQISSCSRTGTSIKACGSITVIHLSPFLSKVPKKTTINCYFIELANKPSSEVFKREEDESPSYVQRSTSGILSSLNDIGRTVTSSSPRTESVVTKNFESLLRQPSLTNPFNSTNTYNNAEPHRVHWKDTQTKIEKSKSQGNILRRKDSITNLVDTSTAAVRIIHSYFVFTCNLKIILI